MLNLHGKRYVAKWGCRATGIEENYSWSYTPLRLDKNHLGIQRRTDQKPQITQSFWLLFL